jgi:hypothetical protein
MLGLKTHVVVALGNSLLVVEDSTLALRFLHLSARNRRIVGAFALKFLVLPNYVVEDVVITHERDGLTKEVVFEDSLLFLHFTFFLWRADFVNDHNREVRGGVLNHLLVV